MADTTPQHTPTPWKLERGSSNSFRLIDADGELIAYLPASRHIDEIKDPEQIAALDLIVRAVNSHAALVEALEEAVGFAGSMYRIFSDPNFTDRYDDAGRSARTRDYLRAALAAAKGTR